LSLRLYTLLLRLLLPLVVLRLRWRSLKAPGYGQRIDERLGRDRPGPDPADLWVHAVSVGEVQAAAALIHRLLERQPPLRILVTTTTPTGTERLATLFGERVSHLYTPYDLPEAVAALLDRARPRLLVVMETEIWPNTLVECARRRIPTVLANARLSERSARGYRRVQPLTRETLRRFDLIAAQTQADADRFLWLGADPDRVTVTGSVKFDQRTPADLQDRAEAMRRLWGTQRPVWVAASTHEGEEEQVLSAHKRILERIPEALLVLVPRHPERFDRVAALAQRQGLTPVRRSARAACPPNRSVFLGDTMGELPVFLAAADAAFVGGSLVPVGGHNLLEAAAVGVPVATGPHTFNFAAIVELLTAEGAAAVVTSPESLAELMIRWLSDAAMRASIGERGRRAVERNRGALGRLIEIVESRLDVRADAAQPLPANPGGPTPP
jgi:3-deoxy-D-manno-octulosonic-acid transferase